MIEIHVINSKKVKTPSRARMWNFGLFLVVISNGILYIVEKFDGFKILIILTQLILSFKNCSCYVRRKWNEL